MAVDYIWSLSRLQNKLHCSSAEVREPPEIIRFSIIFPSPEKLRWMQWLDEIYRNTCIKEGLRNILGRPNTTYS